MLINLFLDITAVYYYNTTNISHNINILLMGALNIDHIGQYFLKYEG